MDICKLNFELIMTSCRTYYYLNMKIKVNSLNMNQLKINYTIQLLHC